MAGGSSARQAQESDDARATTRIRGQTDDRIITAAERRAATRSARAAGQRPAMDALGDPAHGMTMMPGAVPHYFGPYPNYANSPLPVVTAAGITGGLRKFIDTLPGLGAASANNLGQYIPVAVADTTSFPGSDYYEIAVIEYEERLHSDLPPTKLRGYVQLSTALVPGARVPLTTPAGAPILLPDASQALAVDGPHYLGPMIVTAKDRPVRILFRNLLPTGSGGDLFLPVDTSVMGSGMGPDMGGMMEMDPLRPMCGETPKPGGCYSENRATLHLHGGLSPWISDGTPHQWITPAGEPSMYAEGVSLQNVPDMPDPGPGASTFFWTNQQSARLMFYHDHSWGITRLNVYAGEAAAYLITDSTETRLVQQGLLPAEQIPLVIQDKTFVPDDAQLALQDPTWDVMRWGGLGSLWMPHVYMPAQNPWDASGLSAFGRWHYGPWFWPPTTNILHGPTANPYYDQNCDPDAGWCEPPTMPGVPLVSMGMESFHDTPLVNGTAYPTITLEPRAYRLRILNAANDRSWSLSLYRADASGSEVALVPAEVQAALTDTTVFPTPVPGTEGPDWIQVGTEGGFLPAPVVIPAQPTTWVTDATLFINGNVDGHALLLAPAERADVVVDFSAFAGQTLILYNDAPAAFPARDPRYDYYTGSADLTEIGGVPPVQAGYGPNTRTILQIRIAASAPAPAFDLAALQTAFAHHVDGSGVFESSQNPILVGQSEYNGAYGTTFRTNGADNGTGHIFDTALTFKTLAGGSGGPSLTLPFEPKQIQDEMGEAFEREYGRMSGFLGLELPGASAGVQQNMILYPYVNPATEVLDGVELPPGATITPITAAADGVQIWRITHNGVDTHPIHFHLSDVQLVNRVAWDGMILRPDANELGWKDTVRISPLQDTIVALRAFVPRAPFGVVDSVRPLNPMMPLGSTEGFNSTDALANPIVPPIANTIENFGWEYVWHCHILSHEEMDMMRPIELIVARELPLLSGLAASGVPGGTIVLTWNDGTPVTAQPASWGDAAAEVGYRIERAPLAADGTVGVFATIGTALANATEHIDTSTPAGGHAFRVVAHNAAGETVSNTVVLATSVPAAPSGLAALLSGGPRIDLTWSDHSGNESGFVLERADDTGAFATLALLAPDTTGHVDRGALGGHTYHYRVKAVAGELASAYSNTATVVVPNLSAPATPTNLEARLQSGPKVALRFSDNATNESGFVLERGVDGGAFQELALLPLRSGRGNVIYTDLAVQAGHAYAYRVKAVNLGASSAWSATATAELFVPLSPADFRATVSPRDASTSTVTLTWTDRATNESGYLLQRARDAEFTQLQQTVTLGADATGRVETRQRGRTYHYRVQAFNVVGASEWVTLAVTVP